MLVPVSVVIPYRDAQAYLPEALASVEAQTAPPAEVIVVDDGSGLEGRDLLARLEPEVRVITLPKSLGPGQARNVGVAAATQPYVAFLDADDLWTQDKLETQHAFMRAWPDLDASHTEVVFFFADGTTRQREAGERELSLVTALSHHVMITPSIMIKRTSFERIGGFDPRFRCTQDWEMQIRMAEAGFRIQYLPRVLARVRREGHGNHSANWRCYLAGHLGILWKHRAQYLARGGWRAWLHRAAYECWRAGRVRGGVLGTCLGLPYRVGV